MESSLHEVFAVSSVRKLVIHHVFVLYSTLKSKYLWCKGGWFYMTLILPLHLIVSITFSRIFLPCTLIRIFLDFHYQGKNK